jgi:hypothetical protein
MKLRVGDVIEDRRYLPSMRVIGVVWKLTCGGDYAHAVVSKFNVNGELSSMDTDYVFDTHQPELYRLTSYPKLEVVSPGPMASTVDKCSPRCDYEYPESSWELVTAYLADCRRLSK